VEGVGLPVRVLQSDGLQVGVVELDAHLRGDTFRL
jgi:hypothetical protein